MFHSILRVYVKGSTRSGVEILTNRRESRVDRNSRRRAEEIFKDGYLFEFEDADGLPHRSDYPPNMIHRVDWTIHEGDFEG